MSVRPSVGPGSRVEYVSWRPVPPGAEVLVKVGDAVDFDTPVAVVTGAVRRVRIPADLHALPLRKRVGDPVTSGETLAVVSSHLGLGLTEYTCPVDGVIEALEESAINVRARPRVVRAHLPAVVTAVDGYGGLQLTAVGDLLPGWAGIGPPASGPVLLAGELLGARRIAQVLGPRAEGKVVVSTALVTTEVLERAVSSGVAGVIAPSLAPAAWCWPGAAAGQEPPLTVVLLEPFGTPALAPAVRAWLERQSGRVLHLDGGGPGVRLPVVFAPASGAGRRPDTGPPVPGQPVRVLAGPHRGVRAVVVAVTQPAEVLPGDPAGPVFLLEPATGERITAAEWNLEAVGPPP